jgi:magnesium-transporting ATPase (P-type)
MSVLLHDTKSKKYFVFVKGAPERIERNSTLKLKEF